ncbi:related to pepsin precursor [Rhynchosporium secalis]|uniref:Related to pepsin n=1 Tax=Rhynchosporium secalis TaxID=38038 RepID=A0A1E1LWS3_RHYSE|nr:related to pepsin precursor [Rhynchosporium secalis]
MSATQDLQKVSIVTNEKYEKDGLKSYVYLLQKWGFQPTQPGPYVQLDKASESGHLGLLCKMGGNSPATRTLVKVDASGTKGEVTADDQQNDALYLSPVQIGSQPQTLLLDFDTGSADLWVWSTQLPDAIQTSGKKTGHAIFDSKKSDTFKATTNSTWKISYGDKSSASGTVGTDDVILGGLKIEGQSIELAKNISAQFTRGVGDGLLGLAFGKINTVKPKKALTPVENMIAQKSIPKSAELFTAKLGSWRDANEPDKGEGFYTFGYIDQATVDASGGEIYYTPVDSSKGFWTVDSASAVVNGKEVSQPGNTAIMDTGTTLALVSDEVCEAVYGAIKGATYDKDNQGWVYPSATTIDQFPDVTFAIGEKQFIIQKEDLGFVDIGNGTVYGGIQSRGDLPFDILGDTVLKSIYAIFDVGEMRFGAVQRPEQYQNITPFVPE